MKKFLEIGPEKTPQAHLVFGEEDENCEMLTLDVDPEQEPDILADAGDIPDKWYGKFDGVLASHVLEHFRYWDTHIILEEWVKLLKPGGELHVVVPSLEWAARQVLIEDTSNAVMPHLYGSQVNQWQYHHSMFTLRLLRVKMAKAGLMVQRAKTGKYDISVAGNVLEAEQHYVMGVKPEDS